MNKILVILVYGLLSNFFTHRPAVDFSSEAAGPDSLDLSVWKTMKPGIYSGFGSINHSYPKYIPPEGEIEGSIRLTGWKGERVNCQLLVWTSEIQEEISIEASDFKSRTSVIPKASVNVSVIQYVITDQFLNEVSGSCGPRDKDKIPWHLSPDLITEHNRFISETTGVRPVWISVDIPSDAAPGIYTGLIKRKSLSGNVNHEVTLEVQNKLLPPPSEWSFHLDLWQNPFAVARFHHVELWSEQHLELLRPYLFLLAGAGQKCITTTLIDKPWGANKPCYDDFRSMINWIKKKDGTWEYDYTIFDRYVKLAMECGIKKQITCYTMIPLENEFTYFDEGNSLDTIVKLIPGTKDYEDHWRPFLSDFKNHLMKMGWLDITTIGLDEREEDEMAKMFHFVKESAPGIKIAMAGFYHASINSSIYDFSSNWRDFGRIPVDSIPPRREAGLITTYYVACGIPKPNNFTFSPPAESCFEGWLAAAMGFDGFLRWAYNSWPENPLLDSRYIKWPAGDTFIIYPGPQSSVRFERLREGIQDFEKIRILRKELAADSSGKAHSSIEKLNGFLTGINAATLNEKTAADVVNEGKKVIYEVGNDTF